MIRTFRDLRVYKQSYELGKEVHRVTQHFPKYERYELGSQLRRASQSIPLNIAEGYGRKKSKAEFKRFLLIAIGSCNEVQVLLDYAYEFHYLSSDEYKRLLTNYEGIGKQLSVLHSKWK
ncbi:S23 ribosomal protein [Aneurinibacillus migulanus]|nr:S23 ribosomal protein [Aneurinibacillus migulanus]